MVPVLLAALSVASGCNDTSFRGESRKGGSVTPPQETKTPVTTPGVTPSPAVTPSPSQPTAQDTGTKSDQVAEFGDDKVFHLGDNGFGGSSCKDDLDAYAISGTKYFFEFEVHVPNTEVNIAMNRICGVDRPTSTISLMQGSTALVNLPLEPSIKNITLPTQKLNPGRYAVIVETRNVDEDYDDYIIGNIKITGSARLTSVGVRAE